MFLSSLPAHVVGGKTLTRPGSTNRGQASPAHLDYFGVRQGHSQVREVFNILRRDFEISRFVPVDFFLSGNRVLVLLELDAVIRPTRKRFSELLVHVWTFAPHGKVAQFNDVQDSWTVAGALTAD